MPKPQHICLNSVATNSFDTYASLQTFQWVDIGCDLVICTFKNSCSDDVLIRAFRTCPAIVGLIAEAVDEYGIVSRDGHYGVPVIIGP